ncbi:hypothetical protein ACWDG1_47860 [Streptomyces sp. NPDC001177]
MERKLLGMFEYWAAMPPVSRVCCDLRIARRAVLVLGVVAVAWAPGGTAVAGHASVAACQVGLLAGFLLQGRPHLLLQGGELRSVVRVDEAGVGRPARCGVPDQVGDAPVGAEAVAPHLLDLGIQVGQPRAPADGQQQIAQGRESAQCAGAAFPDY